MLSHLRINRNRLDCSILNNFKIVRNYNNKYLFPTICLSLVGFGSVPYLLFLQNPTLMSSFLLKFCWLSLQRKPKRWNMTQPINLLLKTHVASTPVSLVKSSHFMKSEIIGTNTEWFLLREWHCMWAKLICQWQFATYFEISSI